MRRSAPLFPILGALMPAVILVLTPVAADAQITRLVITERDSPTFESHVFGDVGTYEWLIGYAEGELDPADPRNAGIVNLDRAPRNERGRVEYTVDVQILKPVDMVRGNGRIFYDVLNRGSKRALGHRINGGPNANDPRLASEIGTGFLMNQGYTMVWNGWQADVSPERGLMRGEFPIPTQADGSPVTGTHRHEFIFNEARRFQNVSSSSSGRVRPAALERLFQSASPAMTNPSTATLSYPAADLDPSLATLTVRQHERDPRRTPADLRWSYVSEYEIRIDRPAGFDGGAIYEFVYPAKDPVVMGIGFAATRDVVSFLRYEAEDQEGSTNPTTGHIEMAMAMGISQSGRFLRDWLYQGFHEDLEGRVVFEGILPIVAGSRLTQVNIPFSVPGDYARQHEQHTMPGHHFPFTYGVLTDPISGQTDGILARCETRGNCPKIFHIDSDSEMWVATSSLVVTDTQGGHIELPENVRAYLLAGHQHSPAGEPSQGICQRLSNSLDYDDLSRALIVAMDEWITHGTEPPASRYPNVRDGTLVAPYHPRAAFVAIPGFRYFGLAKKARLLDYSSLPPDEGPAYPVFVGTKDADGNNIAGIRHPFVEVPRATYTGWNLRRAGLAENAVCGTGGSYVPFAETEEERRLTRDERLSLEERYPDQESYVERIRQAAQRLVQERLLLPDDVERIVEQAQPN